MADISITHTHKLPRHDAKEAAQKVADQMVAEYELNAQWNGDVLLFTRSGVSGSLTVSDEEARLEISLGFLFKAFAPTIEEKLGAKMKKVFAIQA